MTLRTITPDELRATLDAHRAWRVGTDGERANLQDADLRGADLWGADLRGADLQGADLWGADLWGANLRDADLQDANLWGANLQDADLQDANLRGANLQDANLWGANLQGANLRGANLRGANLRGANLRDANLWGADGVASCGPVGSEGRFLYATWREGALYVQAGCWYGTVTSLAARITPDGKHGWPDDKADQYRAEYEAAIAFLTAQAATKGWTRGGGVRRELGAAATSGPARAAAGSRSADLLDLVCRHGGAS